MFIGKACCNAAVLLLRVIGASVTLSTDDVKDHGICDSTLSLLQTSVNIRRATDTKAESVTSSRSLTASQAQTESFTDPEDRVSALIDDMLKDPATKSDDDLAEKLEAELNLQQANEAQEKSDSSRLSEKSKKGAGEQTSSRNGHLNSVIVQHESSLRRSTRLEKSVIGVGVGLIVVLLVATGFWVKRLMTDDDGKEGKKASRWKAAAAKPKTQKRLSLSSGAIAIDRAKTDPPDIILVFALPDDTKEEEEARFGQLDIESVLKESLLHANLKRSSSHFWHARTLKAARQGAADLLLRLLHEGNGFEIKAFNSIDYDELFVCIRFTPDKALSVADEAEYNVQLDKTAITSLGIQLPIDHQDYVPAYVKCDGEFVDYLREYRTAKGEKSVLRHVDSIRLMYDLITDYIDLNTWQREGLVKHVISPHSRPHLLWLQQNWGSLSKLHSIEQPLDAVRDYFGEETAFYFAFVQFSCVMLAALSGISAVLYAYEIYKGTWFDDYARIAYSVVIIFWTTLFVEFWKRQEAVSSNRWGTDVEDNSTVKAQESVHFKGEMHPNPADMNTQVVMSNPRDKYIGEIVSSVCTLVFTLVVIAGVGANLYLRSYLQSLGYNRSDTAISCSLLLTVQMKIVDKVWAVFSDHLTRLEGHQFEQDFSNSRSTKLMIVKFPNTFTALFYLGFLQRYVEGCPDDCCMTSLCVNMITIYATYVSFGFADIIVPYINLKWAVRKEINDVKETQGGEVQVALTEAQAKMTKYEGEDLFEDYVQVFFPVFFIMLFGVAFPAAPFLTLLCCLCQLRTDAWKLVHACRRPFPAKATGIGDSRLQLLEAMCSLAVIVNWGVIVFLTHPFQKYSLPEQCLAFFVGEQILMLLMLLLKYLTPDIPQSVNLERARQKYQRNKLFSHKVPEDKLEALAFQGNNTLNAYHRLLPIDPYFEEMLI